MRSGCLPVGRGPHPGRGQLWSVALGPGPRSGRRALGRRAERPPRPQRLPALASGPQLRPRPSGIPFPQEPGPWGHKVGDRWGRGPRLGFEVGFTFHVSPSINI